MDSLSDRDFARIKNYVYSQLGIDLDDKKRETVNTKVAKIAIRHKIQSVKEYVEFLMSSSDGEVIQEFFNEITTNTTHFFREDAHFNFIKKNIGAIIEENPRIKLSGELRAWSAPCSSGEEPISLAITLLECLPSGIKPKILATDISEKALRKAMRGVYTENECSNIPIAVRSQYFEKQSNGDYKIGDAVRNCISYRHFNLMDDFNFKKGFDIIFCRNVMIYFDNAVQQKMLDKFYVQLVPGGYFFIGHSESMLNKTHKYIYITNATYKKPS